MTTTRGKVWIGCIAVAIVAHGCTPSDGSAIEGCVARRTERSVARVWNEALLRAIRRDVPAPTVHARNLFHTSAAMWDAWAAYDARAEGYFVDEKHSADDVSAARETALSYAAYRILLHRYSMAAGVQATFDDLAATMRSLCYAIDYVDTKGGSPAALGNRIAAAAIEHGRADGALEQRRYVDPAYVAANDPLVVADGAVTMRDSTRWQPLALARLVAQNGVPIPGNVQRYIGPHWGEVRGFAIDDAGGIDAIDPGAPLPAAGARAERYKHAAMAVIRASTRLDPSDGVVVDVGPGATGDNTLGRNDGDGHEVNPATGRPYAANRVLRGDFTRALAEFWADGPDSETPPGHWNSIANDVSDALGRLIVGGAGRTVGRLEWDVKLYLALNGALHDAAVAAWGIKRRYDSVRPISMIRYMAARGQSSDPSRPSYDPQGLPLVRGLVELVTRRSSAPGRRHDHLAAHVGEVAVRAWRGPPPDPAGDAAGVGWIRASTWTPYQRPTFVTPAFPGFVSGHSTFSRAAATVLTRFTGSAFFPGGLSEWTVTEGDLVTERGPTRDVTLQWATYHDAADQAGVSRIFGGIHILADDLAGRRIGAACGEAAWERALRYYSGGGV